MTETRLVLFKLLTGALVLLAPAVSLLLYHDYPLLRPESLCYLALWAGVGAFGALLAHRSGRGVAALVWASLLILSFDLQFGLLEDGRLLAPLALWLTLILAGIRVGDNTPKIILAGYAGIIGSSLLIGPEQAEVLEERDPISTHRKDNPVVLHLILDGYIGLRGIPQDIPGGPELRDEIRYLFAEHGFQVFDGAYSESIETHRSLAGIFNDTDEPDGDLVKAANNKDWRLTRNAYLNDMAKRGYRIHIRQSSFLDVCSGIEKGLASCVTTRYDRLRHVMGQGLSIRDMLVLFASFQVAHSGIYSYLQQSAVSVVRAWSKDVLSSDHASPIRRLYDWRQTMVWSLGQSQVFDALYRDIRHSPGGEIFLIHHMKPHGPYVYDQRCSVRSVAEWTNRRNRWAKEGNNDEASRRERYLRYFEQTRCLNRQIAGLLERLDADGVLNEMIMLVHGDHGSRIFQFAPADNQADKMSSTDHLDAYSALFVAHVPGKASATSQAVMPLRRLLRDAVTPQETLAVAPD